MERVQDSNHINHPSTSTIAAAVPHFIPIFVRSANKIPCLIFPILPRSLPHFLAYYPSPSICVEMASAVLVGSENVQCTIVAMDQADRQAASHPQPPLSGLFTRFPSIRLICVFSLFWGFGNLNTRQRVKEAAAPRYARRGKQEETVTKKATGEHFLSVHVFCVKGRERERGCGGLINTWGLCVHLCVCVFLRLHGLSVTSCMLTESGG